MKKLILAGVVVVGGLALLASCSDRPVYQDVAYNQPAPIVQQAPTVVAAPAPVYVQPSYSGGGFLDRHGDAILAGGAGYLAGKAASRPSYRPTTVIKNTYVSRPSYRSSSSFRSSSFGSFRSRRR